MKDLHKNCILFDSLLECSRGSWMNERRVSSSHSPAQFQLQPHEQAIPRYHMRCCLGLVGLYCVGRWLTFCTTVKTIAYDEGEDEGEELQCLPENKKKDGIIIIIMKWIKLCLLAIHNPTWLVLKISLFSFSPFSYTFPTIISSSTSSNST